MRRPLSIAVLLAVTMLPLAVQGQRSMGGFRGSSAPRGRMGSGFVSRPSAGFVSRPVGRFAAAPAFRAAPSSAFRSNARIIVPRSRVFITTRPFFNNRLGFRHFHNHVFFNNCFNFFDPFVCGTPFAGAPFFGSPFYDPFFYDSSYYSQPAPQQPVVAEGNGDNGQLALQVQELSDQIQSMRDEDRAREQNQNNAASSSSTQNQETLFVFRDGHRISARNYAITGGTVWVLDQNAAHKYSLNDLDPAATEQANEKNGVDFHLPAAPANH